MSKKSPAPPASPKADIQTNGPVQQQKEAYNKPDGTELKQGPSGHDVLLFLIGSRLLNALVIQTFFQPDEYFQSLEPAWELAFGAEAGAWITWVQHC